MLLTCRTLFLELPTRKMPTVCRPEQQQSKRYVNVYTEIVLQLCLDCAQTTPAVILNSEDPMKWKRKHFLCSQSGAGHIGA